MSESANRISEQIIALENESERNQRDARFYLRLLTQLALMRGGSIEIDPKFGDEAINGRYGFEIDSKGFHLTLNGKKVANPTGDGTQDFHKGDALRLEQGQSPALQ